MFARRSPVILIQNVIGAVLGLVGLFFITRFVGTTDWGFVSFGIGFVGILSLLEISVIPQHTTSNYHRARI